MAFYPVKGSQRALELSVLCAGNLLEAVHIACASSHGAQLLLAEGRHAADVLGCVCFQLIKAAGLGSLLQAKVLGLGGRCGHPADKHRLMGEP